MRKALSIISSALPDKVYICLMYYKHLEWMIEGVQIENSRILEQICLNILMFIPLGFLLPESFANLTEKT